MPMNYEAEMSELFGTPANEAASKASRNPAAQGIQSLSQMATMRGGAAVNDRDAKAAKEKTAQQQEDAKEQGFRAQQIAEEERREAEEAQRAQEGPDMTGDMTGAMLRGAAGMPGFGGFGS